MKKLNIALVFVCLLACVFVLSSCLMVSTCASHSDIDSNGLCDMCGAAYTCPGHADVNADSMCDFCLATFSCTEHYDENGDQKCDNCKALYICENHTDKDADSVCDLCRAPYVCPGHCDVNADGACDECGVDYVCPGHVDVDSNGKCEVCKARFECLPAHRDSDGNGFCDKCQAEFVCTGHIDAGADGRCDKCDMIYVCPGHVDANKDNKCDVCHAPYKTPVDYREGFEEVAKTTNPMSFTITIVTEEAGIGTLTSTYTVTYGVGGAFTVVGTMQKFNESLEGDLIITVPVNVTCDGKGNYSDGGEFAGKLGLVEPLTVDYSALKNYTTPTQTLLNATVAAADTEAVFGVSYDSDVTLVVNKSETKIVTVAISYDNVTITCEYK